MCFAFLCHSYEMLKRRGNSGNKNCNQNCSNQQSEQSLMHAISCLQLIKDLQVNANFQSLKPTELVLKVFNCMEIINIYLYHNTRLWLRLENCACLSSCQRNFKSVFWPREQEEALEHLQTCKFSDLKNQSDKNSGNVQWLADKLFVC